MGDFSQSDSKIFSLRIVSIDYYMAPPIPGLDISYSSFQGGKVNEVPVIRIYGSTPAGQKTCLHIHKALPYLYVPCSDLLFQPGQEASECTQAICLAIEKALKLKVSAGSKRQHVHSCSLVRAKKFYGYHSSEELFVKIYMYHPQDISRASNLLLGGAVLDRISQPHESHVPFLLQFFIDYNLYGMGHIHVSKIKFRHPVPDVVSQTKDIFDDAHREAMDQLTVNATNAKADLGGDSCLASSVWTSSTIPDDWIWQSWSPSDASIDKDLSLVKRRSTSELEGDAVVEDIFNQLHMSYTPLSQTCSEVKMVQSLIPIWEEEFERTGIQAPAVPFDAGKPLPEDVLKILSRGLELEKLLTGLIDVAENSSISKQSIKPLTGEGNIAELSNFDNNSNGALQLLEIREELGLLPSGNSSSENEGGEKPDEGQAVHMQQLSVDLLEASSSVVPSNVKASDQDALSLLKWLASSQAVEEINSDDELARETILGPLLPSTTIDKVLEKANMDFENQSQQECLDILDSVEDSVNAEQSNDGSSTSDDHKLSCDISFKKIIPQLDGSTDDISLSFGVKSSSKVNYESGTSSESQHDGLSFISDRKRKRHEWGSLPFSSSPSMKYVSDPSMCNMIGFNGGETKDTTENSFPAKVEVDKCLNFVEGNLDGDDNCREEARALIECSMRDLMRKKRCHRIELPESTESQVGEDLSDEEQKLDSSITELRNDGQISRPLASSLSRPAPTDELVADCGSIMCPELEEYTEVFETKKSNSSLHGKYPVPSGSECVLGANISKDGQRGSSERLHCETHVREISGFQDYGICGSSQFLGECKQAPTFLDLENHKSAVFMEHDWGANKKSEISQAENFPLGIAFGSSCQFFNADKGEILQRDHSIVDAGCKSLISMQETPEISDENLKRPGLSTGVTVMQSDIQIDGCRETNSRYTGLCNSISTSINMKADPLELVGMTFYQKPPVTALTDETGSSFPLSPIRAQDPPDVKENVERIFLPVANFDHFPPFFKSDLLAKKEFQNVTCRREDNIDNEEAVMGVPVHYQNDGSYLYMLTPIPSPPSTECVKRWLFDGRSKSRKSMAAGLVLPTEDSLTQACNSSLLESPEKSELKCKLDNLNQHNQQNSIEDVEPHHDEATAVQQKEGKSSKSNPSIGCSEEMSQLSGPDVKSKPTPLSQIGFRDPASVSGRQQLTMLSIEVQAESRGDLKPDPRFDAINIITLVFQQDDDPTTTDAFILLRSNNDTFKENRHGISDCKVLVLPEEKHMFSHFMKIIHSFDPDILMGWDIQGGSLGFLAERAAHLGFGLLNNISRTPPLNSLASGDLDTSGKEMPDDLLCKAVTADTMPLEDAIIEDEWGRTHASGVHVGGRIVLNIWRLMRNEVNLNFYTVEAVAEAVLRKKIPSIPWKVLTKWFSSGPCRARYRCLEYVLKKAKLNFQIMNQLDMINRTSELARVFGIDFFSVLSRGSQYRVESMFLRLAHTQNYIAISPGNQQVAYQPAMECLPLVMEPESGFYADPVIVLDFQSLYPSMIIAYNLCFSTCLGKITSSKANTLGVSSYSPDLNVLRSLKDEILLTPNGVMYVPAKVRKGVLPRLLEEILSTRIMVKQAMKKLTPSQQVLHRIFNARQLALKLIANVTYGYTAAGFSGRMPCAELADSIVQCGRKTLESAIAIVNNHDKWKAKVIYGDTDSMFVLLKGRTRKEAFEIGDEIAAAVSAMNPNPITLKMEKVYHPCFLLTKKRYVGYSYESPDQSIPKFDAKGIETIRRDTCGAVSKTMEQSLRLFFEHQDIDKVKAYLLRQWRRIISGRISLQDFVFAKEVRLGTYSAQVSSLPPAAIVATKAMKVDPRAEPRYAERVPYVVVHGEPGARLVDMVVDPLDLLSIDSPFRLNDIYYIRKQIIPALQRVFGLVGAELNQWFSDLPRPQREAGGKRHLFASNSHRTRIDYYYLSKHCVLCGALVQASAHLCDNCSMCEGTVATALTGRTAKLEKDIQHLVAICRHCGGGDWLVESGVKCMSLACSVFYERRKIQKELKSLSAVATEAGFYPRCMAEWF